VSGLPVVETVKERLDPSRSALLIVDMQRDFCEPGGAAEQAGRDIAPARAVVGGIRRLLDAARAARVLVCHIGFWTLPGHLSDSGPWLDQRRRSTWSSERMCLAGSPGAGFIDELAPLDGEPVVHKHRYSGFTGTDLDQILRSRRIHTCVVCGVSTNVCVESTVRDAFERDYYVVVPDGATASWSASLRAASLENVEHRFGLVLEVDEVIERWRKGAA
jgi:nicotinamidase-related amidase